VSVEAVTWALNLAPVPADKNGQPNTACAFVLVGLANHADPDGTATFPSARTLARYARLSVRCVRTALDRLEEAGVIAPCDPAIIAARIRRGDRRPQGWNLNTSLIRDDLTDDDLTDLERLFPGLRQRVAAAREPQASAGDGVNPAHPAPPGPVDNSRHGVKPVHPVSPDGVSPVPHGVKPVPRRGEPGSPEPSFKPSINPPEGRAAPATGDSDESQDRDGRAPTARRLIAAYVAGCPARPPSAVLGQLGRQVAVLLAEGIDPEAIARALDRFSRKPMHPSVLASLVNEELNAHGPPSRAVPVAVAVAVPDADPDNPAAYIAALRGGSYRATTAPQAQGRQKPK
jgi:hypothetical protein